MSREFILLTESDYKDLLKLKEQHEKRNAYHNEYYEKKLQELKHTNQEEYKIKMIKQNEANKIYKQN